MSLLQLLFSRRYLLVKWSGNESVTKHRIVGENAGEYQIRVRGYDSVVEHNATETQTIKKGDSLIIGVEGEVTSILPPGVTQIS